ncbi:transposase [Ectothiorhodospira marina]|uniref:Transposase n=1 Tax=Ectothiorhodospira marina TaxID=1396821 RepID=A0A1H7PC91_9GAMM|nr:transposase [Ectothiorhodospira marina]SEL32895.1 transposase [Ectothiorhodospira marina]SEL63087.1 transposase [Ectothiorhodospira marina]
MSKKARRRYTAEFKAEAVALVERQEYGVAEAARSLGINRSLLDRWMRKERERQSPQHDQQEGQAEELERLREENRKLRMEKEILKKAAAFFAKESN